MKSLKAFYEKASTAPLTGTPLVWGTLIGTAVVSLAAFTPYVGLGSVQRSMSISIFLCLLVGAINAIDLCKDEA